MHNIVRRQQSRSELPIGEKLELRELKGRLVMENGRPMSYGTTNVAFEDDDDSTSIDSNITPSKIMTADMAVADDKGHFLADPEDGRESWDSKLQFMLATIGYAVGLGNVWRFPYLAQKNGGGAFLIPYFIMLAVEGIPVFYLELAIGQRLRKGAIGAWNLISVYAGGIGLASAVVSFNVALYYNTIIAWCIFYFYHSFKMPLPWTDCPPLKLNNDSFVKQPECEKSSPTQYFWYRTTLDISSDINEPESFNISIAICLMISWCLCYCCMIKGIASSGKVVYITATFPYLVLIIFFFRGITLDGMGDGIKHLFTPDWSKLSDPVVWLEAGTQIFFSLGLGFGGLIAFASYNPVHNNCYRDAIFVALTNCGTSMFAGIVVFSVMGFKANHIHKQCLEERDRLIMANDLSVNSLYNVTTLQPIIPECDLQKELDKGASGTGLAFIVFTDAINQFPGISAFWSLLFFSMLFTLGIDSQFGTLEGAVTSIVDLKLFPNLRKEILTGAICLISFFISLIFCNGSGNYIFTLFDDFAGNFPLLIVAFCECIAVSYVYGLKKFSDEIELMTGRRVSHWYLFCWRYLSPLVMATILIASFIKLSKGSGYDAWNPLTAMTEHKEWPPWATVLIFVLILMSVLWIPGIAILRVLGVHVLPDEEASWFPAEELRKFHKIIPRKVTPFERFFFNMKDEEPSDDV
ncbi:sodium-dependent neutral amino acid transporter B(0)AT3-like [Oppia nitens]|uniref:sodium-dependent neutral amino acid transporter B(0)AT3-like n=1 Tax=Oppia nitens TaxID=1686743 RepID=UPI0023DB911F|nr:sodium-dependent neutral amino acid transporter B(0)AT3-like [Oppia nitens]